MRSIKGYILSILLCLPFLFFGQEIPEEIEEEPDTTNEFIAAADTNLVDEIVENISIFTPKYEYIPEFTNDQIADRLSCIENEIKLTYNPKINSFIDFFVRRRREYSMMVLQRQNLYFPMFERMLRKYNMPQEIKYLAVVESGLKPRAISPSSAVGLWQFIPSTGRHYGLRIDSYIDERLDPEKSTEAACKYLSWLYRAFGDWQLALASYNCGPGYVSHARKRAGFKGDFWQIYNYLPAETRSYVPQFIAISYLMNYSEEHNLFPLFKDAHMHSDTVNVSGYCDLNTMADLLQICPEDINQLNLELKKNVIPEDLKNYTLKLPLDVISKFKQNRISILDSCASVKPTFLYAKSTRLETNTSLNENQKVYYNTKSRTYYKVKQGDNLLRIASKYGVSLVQIKKWNNLHSNNIRAGQRLLIYGKAYTKAQKNNYSNKNTNVPSKPNPKTTKKTTTHIVKKGETLYMISKKYNTNVEFLKRINNIGSNSIRVGQSIKIN